MKITKRQLRRLIKEEIEGDDTLIRAIEKLSKNIEKLDGSVDFLSAAFTGGDPLSIGQAQKQIGRAYRPAPSLSQRTVGEQKTYIRDIIEEELAEALGISKATPADIEGADVEREIARVQSQIGAARDPREKANLEQELEMLMIRHDELTGI